MLEFPKMLYRAGTDLIWEGRNLSTAIVQDAEAEAEAIAAGWSRIEDFLKADAATVASKVRKGK